MSAVAMLIDREIALISQFVAILKSEQDILAQGNTEGLEQLASNKITLTQQLNALETERLAQTGLDPASASKGQMEQWLENHGDEAATVNWQKLLNFAREAKSLNETNRQLVEMHLRRTADALAILTHQADKPSLYGATGQTLATTGSRIVDSA